MRKREVYKEAGYFKRFVAFSDKALHRYETKLQEPDLSREHMSTLRHGIFRERFHRLISRYSAGVSIDELKKDFPTTVEDFVEYYGKRDETFDVADIDDYVRALWIVSLCILLDVDKANVSRVVNVMKQAGKDAILDKLVSLALEQGDATEGLAHPKPYKHLYQAIISEADRTDEIKIFLKEYYKSMRSTYWYNKHLKDDTIFFGYWCFELAAFVKCLDIDDRAFADNIFYPRDLTGRQLLRTWEDSEAGAADRALYKEMKEGLNVR